MIEYENQCRGCEIPCINCGLKKVAVFYCDDCGDEITDENGCNYQGNDLCRCCLFEQMKRDGITTELSEG